MEAPHMPWAITVLNGVLAAYSASRWAGFRSPEASANSWISSLEIVRSMTAKSPIFSSLNVVLRMVPSSLGLTAAACGCMEVSSLVAMSMMDS